MADQVQGIRRLGIVGVYYSTVCGIGESAIRHMYVEVLDEPQRLTEVEDRYD
jgi:hypothetical protein